MRSWRITPCWTGPSCPAANISAVTQMRTWILHKLPLLWVKILFYDRARPPITRLSNQPRPRHLPPPLRTHTAFGEIRSLLIKQLNLLIDIFTWNCNRNNMNLIVREVPSFGKNNFLTAKFSGRFTSKSWLKRISFFYVVSPSPMWNIVINRFFEIIAVYSKFSVL